MRRNGGPVSTSDSGHRGAIELVPTAAFLYSAGIFCRSRKILSADSPAHHRVLVIRMYGNIIRWNDDHGLHAACLRDVEDREVT